MMGPFRGNRWINRPYAAWKYLLSFFHAEWRFENYPVWVREQEVPSGNETARLKVPRFTAMFVNWAGPSGSGETAEEALSGLKASFESVRSRRVLPRPGTGLPVEYASQIQINRDTELANDFVRRVLNVEWAILTDESSLFDFHDEGNNDSLNAKIKEIYGVDVSDIQSGNLVEIFGRIRSRSHS